VFSQAVHVDDMCSMNDFRVQIDRWWEKQTWVKSGVRYNGDFLHLKTSNSLEDSRGIPDHGIGVMISSAVLALNVAVAVKAHYAFSVSHVLDWNVSAAAYSEFLIFFEGLEFSILADVDSMRPYASFEASASVVSTSSRPKFGKIAGN